MEMPNSKEAKNKNNSRAKFRCPADLAEFIELARFAPPGVELLTVEEIKALTSINSSPPTLLTPKQALRELKETYDRCFFYFPEEARKKILESYPATTHPGEWLLDPIEWAVYEWYPRFVDFVKTIRQIAKFYDHLRKSRDRKMRFGLLFRGQLLPPRPKVLVDIISPKSSVIGLGVDDPFLKSLLGVDGDRIRQCEICERIYWAKRREARYCTPKCGNLLRQREYRNLSKAEHTRRSGRRRKTLVTKAKRK